MERQTPDCGTTGRCSLGLSQRAGAGANWPGWPDRSCAAAARLRQADHRAGAVRGGSRWPDQPDRGRASAAIPRRAVYPPRFRFLSTGAAAFPGQG
ncbi:hypothetical protein NDU88_002782 [Pleurodeles waltl]|uniref:Uncharacterized protein n=1 Tax=Pleurodeles waltl TaxID=8319 RepID=A0AAV7P7Y2_PLEWA|nr:hypothetical protein NDU88_002782 [Pleurodeles waltl]